MSEMIHKAISEYGYIGCGKNYSDHNKYSSSSINCEQFKELEEFHKNSSKTIFTYVPNCKGKVLQAINNYVGVIQTQNLSLEILPKIYDGNKEQENRDIFVKMLLKIYNIPKEIEGTEAFLDTSKDMNLFEAFIKMFVTSVNDLIRKGIKSDYITVEDNLFYLKGKLLFSNHIRHNLVHKERFYVEYDEYIEDRVENRLLKTCIEFLLSKSTDDKNQTMLREQLFFFDQVSISSNIELDFSKITYNHRGMEHYELPLKFAEIFLKNEAFSPTKGASYGFSFLFPMDKIFENYVEELLKENDSITNLKTKFKGEEKLLACSSDADNKIIGLEPDYTFTIDNNLVIADAKWKLIEEDNNGVSKIKREDVYQMYAYLNYFSSNTGYIFAPKISNIQECEEYRFIKTDENTDKILKIYYIDLINEKQDIKLSF